MRVSTYESTPAVLPNFMAVVQDGGYFYCFEDETHANDDGREPILFVEGDIDPEFGDTKMAQAARDAFCNRFPSKVFIFV